MGRPKESNNKIEDVAIEKEMPFDIVKHNPPIKVMCTKDKYMGIKSKLELGETYLCRAEKDTTLKILYEIKYGRDWEWHDSVKFKKVEE